VYFTNVRFLRNLQEQSKAKSRLKEWLVLLMRCLTLLCLVLAFSQPFLPVEKNIGFSGNKLLSIYIDNSFSTQNVNSQGAVLEIEKAKARDLVRSLSNSDKIQIITNDFEGKHQRLHSKQDALSVIDEIKVSPVVRPLHAVLQRQEAFLKQFPSGSKRLFVFSDLQKSSFTLSQAKVDTAMRVYVLPVLPNVLNNVFVDSCWFESPLQQIGFMQHLHARVVNAGTQTIDVLSAKLLLNGQQVALSSFSLAPQTHTEIKFSFTCKHGGFNYADVQIDDFPITFDDHLYFAFNSAKNIDVCLIQGNEKASKPEALFAHDSLFVFHRMNARAIDYAYFKTADVVVLDQLTEFSSGLEAEVSAFAKKGGSLVMIPAMSGNLASAASFYKHLHLPDAEALDTNRVVCEEIDQQKGFFEGVFEKKVEQMNLPVVKKHYRYRQTPEVTPVLRLQNGDLLLGESILNRAKVYFFSTALAAESGNLYNHALLVPTLYKICFNSVAPVPLYFTVGGRDMLEMPANPDFVTEAPQLKNTKTAAEFIPEYRVFFNTTRFYFEHQPQEPGYYDMRHRDKTVQALAFNYSRVESDLRTYLPEELQQELDKNHLTNFQVIDSQSAKAGELITLVEGGKKLWKLFLLLALFFITAEVLILRFLKQ
jgi:hypothetical protein